MSKVAYILVDETTGHVLSAGSVPQRFFPRSVPSGQRMVVFGNGKAPNTTQLRVDLRKVRQPMTFVERVDDVLACRQPEIRQPDAALEIIMRRHEALGRLDREFARRMDEIAGPLADLHAEKRRQAEAGGGPLVAGEADRLAILENAANQHAAIAALEAEYRTIRARLKAVATLAELEAIQLSPDDKPIG